MSSRVLHVIALLTVALMMVSCKGDASRDVTPAAEERVSQALAPAVAEVPKASISLASAVALRQPARSSGGIIASAWRQPAGSAGDRSVWDNFLFETPHLLSEVRWRGAYDPAKKGSGGPVINFTVDIYGSIPTGSEPNLAQAPLVHYVVGDNAGETRAEKLSGVQTYEYRFALPQPFEAAPLKSYWVQIVAFQTGDPDWGFAVGSLGDGRHFRLSGAAGEGYYHQLVPDDVALELVALGEGVPTPAPEIARSLEEIEQQMADMPPAEEIPVNAQGVQELTLVVSRSGYTPVHFAVKAGVPVKLTFRQLGYVPGGNELNVRWGPQEGTYVMLSSITDKKVLEFTPEVTGDYRYSCPHDWYWGVMTVRE